MRIRSRRSGVKGLAWGLFFIGLGIVMLLSQLGWLHGDVWQHAWPFWPAIFGIGHLVTGRSAKSIGDGAFMVLISGYLFVSNEELWGLGWTRSWPLVLVAVGVAELVKVIAARWLPEREVVVEVSENEDSDAQEEHSRV